MKKEGLRKCRTHTPVHACTAAGPRPEIYNLALSGDLQTYAVQSHCWVAFNLSDAITGFQDIQYYTDPKGGEHISHLACIAWPVLVYIERLEPKEA